MSRYPFWCAECWVATQIFRNLGFSAEQIFFGHVQAIHGAGGAARPYAVVAVQASGQQYVWAVEPLDGNTFEIERVWSSFVVFMNSASEAELKAVSDSSSIVRGGKFSYLELWKQLRERGIAVPAFAEADEKLRSLSL